MTSEIRSLTGLRGVAACWVMAGHYIRGPGINPTVDTILFHSYIAVDLFMILSGFVLAMAYGDRCTARLDGQIYRRFYLHRLARIYPLYGATTLVCWLLIQSGIDVWGGPDSSIGGLAGNLLLTQLWWWPNDSLNATGWSISTEWAANLAFPLFAIAVLRVSLRYSCMAAGVAALSLLVAALWAGQTGVGHQATGAMNWYTAPLALVRCTAEFIIGMFCWRLRSHSAWTRKLAGTPVLAILLAGALALTLNSAFDLIIVLLMALLIIGFSHQRSWICRAFGTPVIRWLGLISFSIYLWQMPLLTVRPLVVRAIARISLYPEALATAAMLGIVIAVSAVSLYLLEKPGQRWLRATFERLLKPVPPIALTAKLV